MSETDSDYGTEASPLRMESALLEDGETRRKRTRQSSFSIEPIKNAVDTFRRRSASAFEPIFASHSFRRNSQSTVESFSNPLCDDEGFEKEEEVFENGSEAGRKPLFNGDAKIVFEKTNDESTREDGYVSIALPVTNVDDNDGENNNISNVVSKSMIDHSKTHSSHYESPLHALRQLILPFLIAGLGNVATGYTLDHVKDWKVFNEIPQLIILVPALLGLKGNVEMTLASRLSTHANLGDLDHPSKRRQIIIGNMALVQCQASAVGFIAPFISLALSYVLHDDSNDHVLTAQEIVLLSSSSVITANVANLFLGSIMCLVVVFSRKYNINPDNIATPIAASLGDFTTMILLSQVSRFLFRNMHLPFLAITALAVLLLLIPVWGHITRSIRFTRQILLTGWIPIISAMLLQNTGGLIMKQALDKYKRLAAFQPVINGVGGNLVAIHSSRMSTFLHMTANPGELPSSDPKVCTRPSNIFCGSRSPHSAMARLLLYISVPSHVFFLVVIRIVRAHYYLTTLFFFVYLSAAVTQVAILLQLAYVFVHWTWKRGINPDNSVIPFLTAFADLIGSGLLAVAFFSLEHLADANAVQMIAVRPFKNATL